MEAQLPNLSRLSSGAANPDDLVLKISLTLAGNSKVGLRLESKSPLDSRFQTFRLFELDSRLDFRLIFEK